MKIKIPSLSILLFLNLAVIQSQISYAQCGPGRNAKNLNYNDAINNAFSNVGQSFKVSNCSGAIEGITIRVETVNSPGEVEFKIYADEVSSTVVLNGTFSITSADQEIYIPIDPPLAVTFDEYYTFVITETFGDANYSFYNSNGGTEDFYNFGKIWTSPSLEPTNFSPFSGDDDLYFIAHYRDDQAPFSDCYDTTIELDTSGSRTISPFLLIDIPFDDSGYMDIDIGTAFNGTILDTDDSDVYIPSNPDFYYDQYAFIAPVDGTYKVSMSGDSSDDSGFIFLLYDAPPVPNSGLFSNRAEYIGVSGFEDDGTLKTSKQTHILSGGQTYYVQTSTFIGSQTGTYKSAIVLESDATVTSADVGTLTMPLLFTDPNGNTDTCNAVVTIMEGTGPTITCPADITVCEGGIVEYDELPIVIDDKDLPPIELNDFTYLGVNQGKTFYLSDEVYLSSVLFNTRRSGGFLATIENQAQNDFLRAAVSAQGVDNFMIGYTDRYTEGTYKWLSTSESTFTNWSAGHPNTAQEDIDYTEVTPSGQWKSFNYIRFVTRGRYVIEFTGGQELISGIPFGNVFLDGTTTNTYQVTDTAGNTATCSIEILVESAPAVPTMVCPENITINQDIANCSMDVTVPQPTMIADNCGSRVIPVSAATPFNFNEQGQLLDTSLNLYGLSTATEDVLLQVDFHRDYGDGAPECFDLKGPDGSQVYIACNRTGACDIITDTFTISQAIWNSWISTYGTTFSFSILANTRVYMDGCDSASISQDYFRISAISLGDIYLTNDITGTSDASAVYPVGNTTVTWTLTDKAGNTSTCEQTITVNDIQAPTISCPADISVTNTNGTCSAVISVPKPTIIDNCLDVIPLNVGPYTPLLFNGNTLNNTPTTLEDVMRASAFDITISVEFRGDFDSNNECFVLNDPRGDQIFSACGLQSNCEVQNRSFTIDKNVWNDWISTFGFDLTFTLASNIYVKSSDCNEISGDFYRLTVNTPNIKFYNDYTGTENAVSTYPVGTTDVIWTAIDGFGNSASCTQKITVDNPDNSCSVLVSPKVYLQGSFTNPNINEETLMRDDLRIAGLLPTTTPYADGLMCNTAVFDVTGANAIVDWVWLELRDSADNTSIIASRSALLQRDGDIVHTDGVSPIYFSASTDNYYIVVNHRNHLGVMSNNTVMLSQSVTTVDFTDSSFTTYGNNAQTTIGMPPGVQAMWAGDVNSDGKINLIGNPNDSNQIRDTILNDPINQAIQFYGFNVIGYNNADANLSGGTQIIGSNNDVNVIRDNILNHPINLLLQFYGFNITEQLPSN